MANKSNWLLALGLVGAVGAGILLSRRPSPPPALPAPGLPATPAAGAPVPTPPEDPRLAAAVQAIAARDWQRAREELERIGAGDPDYPNALYNLGVLHEKLGSFQASVEAFRKLLEIDSRVLDAWIGLGWSQYRLGQLEEAERSTLRALEIDATSQWPRYNLGLIRLARGELEEAVESYKQALQQDPARSATPTALEELKMYAAAHPDDHRPAYTLALFHYVLKDYASEHQALGRYLEKAEPGPLRERALKRLPQAREDAVAAGLLPASASPGEAPAPGPGAGG